MELDYLHEFVTLAQICNFQKAANMLYISQSSLSKHIMSLEEELGNSLFIRTTRKVELSGFGSAFLPYAVQIDRIRQEYTAATATSPLPESKKLVIGMLPFSVIYDLTDLIPWFKNEYPSYQLEIVSGETEELRELLRRRQCDAVIVRELPGKEEEFCRLIYTTDPMTAILPAVHPLAREKRISLSQLAAENLLLLPPDTLTYQVAVSSLRQAGINPRISYTSNYSATLVDLVGRGMGVSMLTRRAAQHQATETVSVVDIFPAIPVNVNVLYPKEGGPFSIISCVLNYIREKKKLLNG